MGSQEWWNKRFNSRDKKLMRPEQKLVEAEKNFTLGNVLDIACGEGRNSLFLVQKGYNVTAIDFSHVALERLKEFASIQGVDITTRQVDCSKPQEFSGLGNFDIIIVNHYRLATGVLEEVLRHKKQDGILWINGFRTCPVDNKNITYDDLLDIKEYETLRKLGYQVNSEEYETELGEFICISII